MEIRQKTNQVSQMLKTLRLPEPERLFPFPIKIWLLKPIKIQQVLLSLTEVSEAAEVYEALKTKL